MFIEGVPEWIGVCCQRVCGLSLVMRQKSLSPLLSWTEGRSSALKMSRSTDVPACPLLRCHIQG